MSKRHEGHTQETKVFARLFQKAAQSRRVASSLGWASESSYGALFLIAFSLAPSFPREKAEKNFSRKHLSVQTDNRFPLFLWHTRRKEKVNKKKRRAPAGAELSLFEKSSAKTFVTLRACSREVFDKSQFIRYLFYEEIWEKSGHIS